MDSLTAFDLVMLAKDMCGVVLNGLVLFLLSTLCLRTTTMKKLSRADADADGMTERLAHCRGYLPCNQ